MREIIELCRKMNYKKVGLAFCVGFHKEAKIFCRILRERGLEVESICCKNGSFDKTETGVPEEGKLKPGGFEASCNPIAQLFTARTTILRIHLERRSGKRAAWV